MAENKQKRLQELTELLNRARRVYEQENREIMSNYEYDRLYDELEALETELGITLSNSPTVQVGYEVFSELPKERHESPMLSLDKTKDVERVKEFLGEQEALVSWKLDGLTVVLSYRDGRLFKAVTRGNGEVGEVITANARVFQNIPLSIPYTGELILRGEAVIGYKDFEEINAGAENVDAEYKNPRNLCSGSVRQLNSQITSKRHVQFFAFSLVRAEGVDFQNSRACQMQWLAKQGFSVVEYHMVNRDTVEQEIGWFSENIQDHDIPSDGLVFTYEDIAYGESLGRTAKFPRDSFAFKWADEIRETKLLEVQWSASRTGLINPVAVFASVELEGTSVSRASLHNVSVMEQLALGVGDVLQVYKANMIIPQIAENLTRSGTCRVPEVCPVCGAPTHLSMERGTKTLHCTNPDCQAKQVKGFALFVSRDALNIEGLSEATLEKFIDCGFLRDFTDIFHLDRYGEKIQAMEGFGEKSYQRLWQSIEKARQTTLPKLLYGLGIANIGLSNAKGICKAFAYDPDRLRGATLEELSAIPGVGEVIAGAYVAYFADPAKEALFLRLLGEVQLPGQTEEAENQPLSGLQFVITGTLTHFENRSACKEFIENRGGKVTGTVTSRTNYLINNDVTSTSSKNRKAKELGIEILSEEAFLAFVR